MSHRVSLLVLGGMFLLAVLATRLGGAWLFACGVLAGLLSALSPRLCRWWSGLGLRRVRSQPLLHWKTRHE